MMVIIHKPKGGLRAVPADSINNIDLHIKNFGGVVTLSIEISGSSDQEYNIFSGATRSGPKEFRKGQYQAAMETLNRMSETERFAEVWEIAAVLEEEKERMNHE
jgi:hypothetical protein